MKPCCAIIEDRVPWETDEELPPDLVVTVCSTCGCRHFELTVDPGALGLRGKGL